jgi:hypothetical protein
MRNRATFPAACAVAMLLQACAAPVQEQRPERAVAMRDSGKDEGTVERIVLTEKMQLLAAQYVAAKNALFTAKDQPCNPIADVCDRVKIEISQPSGSTDCVGLVPEKLTFGPHDNVKKTIVWQIVPPATPNPPNSTFEFYNDDIPGVITKVPGIVVITDSNPAQLKSGKIGNGNAGNKSPIFYNLKNDHNAKLDAAYLPIIVHRIPASPPDPEKFLLCGIPDPRILND